MDVVESGVNYVLKIEIPGANVSDIRVEIHGQK
jgi:HSP20 family protein